MNNTIKIDSKDKILLDELQKNSRESLTNLAKKVKLSIDSTNKRIKRLHETGVISQFSIFIDSRKLGYDLIANVQIKLNNISEEELNKFIYHLKAHNNVIDIITLLGDYDVTAVIIAENASEFEEISRTIRQKFRNIIADWHSVINLKCYKLEEYHF